MNNLLVCFFAVVTVARAINTPLDLVVDLFKNDHVPTVALVESKLEETITAVMQAIPGISLPIPDVTKSYIDGNGDTITLKLTDGHMTGADTKFFVADSTAVTISKTHASVTSRFGYEKLIANYNYESNKNGVVTEGTIVAEIEKFAYEFNVKLNLQTLLLEVVIHRILNEGEVVIKIDGQTNDDVATAIVNNIKNIAAALTKQLLTNLINAYNSNV